MLQPLAPDRRLGHPEPMPDPEVPERPVRRRFSAEYKLRIVEEANAAAQAIALSPALRASPIDGAPPRAAASPASLRLPLSAAAPLVSGPPRRLAAPWLRPPHPRPERLSDRLSPEGGPQQHVGYHGARQVVVGGSESATADQQIHPRERMADGVLELAAVVADATGGFGAQVAVVCIGRPQLVNDALTLVGKRGRFGGPFELLIRAPEICRLASQLGEHLRWGTSLPDRLSELAIITTARFWRAQYEWHAHAPLAEKAGVPAAAVEAIRKLKTENAALGTARDEAKKALELALRDLGHKSEPGAGVAAAQAVFAEAS